MRCRFCPANGPCNLAAVQWPSTPATSSFSNKPMTDLELSKQTGWPSVNKAYGFPGGQLRRSQTSPVNHPLNFSLGNQAYISNQSLGDKAAKLPLWKPISPLPPTSPTPPPPVELRSPASSIPSFIPLTPSHNGARQTDATRYLEMTRHTRTMRLSARRILPLPSSTPSQHVHNSRIQKAPRRHSGPTPVAPQPLSSTESPTAVSTVENNMPPPQVNLNGMAMTQEPWR